jgi:adenine-specific DNA methylase
MGFSSTVAGVASSAALLCLLGKFHEYDNGACRDEKGKRLYWKISAAEIGLYHGDIEREVSNLNSAVYRQRKNCEFHSTYNLAGKRVVKIKAARNSSLLLSKLLGIFGRNCERFDVDLQNWALLYYLAYNGTESQRTFPVYEHEREDDEVDYIQLLPKDHVYRITADGDDDNSKLVRIIFKE